mmetsp:Transcript_8370/g.20725  ORF Transcript_8370/g.20725 Transcript_8370/m.20725 type:complete len:209 (+) Transcript_8370:4470-5096(+)
MAWSSASKAEQNRTGWQPSRSNSAVPRARTQTFLTATSSCTHVAQIWSAASSSTRYRQASCKTSPTTGASVGSALMTSWAPFNNRGASISARSCSWERRSSQATRQMDMVFEVAVLNTYSTSGMRMLMLARESAPSVAMPSRQRKWPAMSAVDACCATASRASGTSARLGTDSMGITAATMSRMHLVASMAVKGDPSRIMRSSITFST